MADQTDKRLYIAPGEAGQRANEWMSTVVKIPISPTTMQITYPNADAFYRPRGPGDTMHLQDDEGAQALQDAMRLRMQLPR
jgi:hypothetical protein